MFCEQKKSAQNGLAYKASNADGHLVQEIRGEGETKRGPGLGIMF